MMWEVLFLGEYSHGNFINMSNHNYHHVIAHRCIIPRNCVTYFIDYNETFQASNTP